MKTAQKINRRASREQLSPGTTPAGAARERATWTFLSNHSHVLICLAREPDLLLRDVADRVGITERGVQKILVELEDAGVLTRQRDGRRNRYRIHPDRPLRHPVESHRTVRALLQAILTPAEMDQLDDAATSDTATA